MFKLPESHFLVLTKPIALTDRGQNNYTLPIGTITFISNVRMETKYNRPMPPQSRYVSFGMLKKYNLHMKNNLGGCPWHMFSRRFNLAIENLNQMDHFEEIPENMAIDYGYGHTSFDEIHDYLKAKGIKL